jgi:hypothetical protein
VHDLLRAEWAKTTAGRTWLWMIVGGLALGAITVLSLASEARGQIAAGTTTAAAATDDSVRYWFTMHLFASMFGALFVTREYASGVIGRSVLLSGGRVRLLVAKVVAATGMGVVLAAVATAVAALAPWLILPRYGIGPQWTDTTWRVLAGVFAVTVLATPWGVLLGWIVRNQVFAIVVLTVTTLGFDPYFTRLLPEVGKYLLTIAMSSVYLDGKSYLLPVPAALAVIVAWIAAAALLAHRVLTRRDVL